MTIDHSQTINSTTYTDASALPKIDSVVNEIVHYIIFSTSDLQSAYHQVPMYDERTQLTIFGACDKLYQFRRIPFVMTNGVACCQRTTDHTIQEVQLRETYA